MVSEKEMQDCNRAMFDALVAISGYELHVCLGAMTQVMAILLVAGDDITSAEKGCDMANDQLKLAVNNLKESGKVHDIVQVVQTIRDSLNAKKH